MRKIHECKCGNDNEHEKLGHNPSTCSVYWICRICGDDWEEEDD